MAMARRLLMVAGGGGSFSTIQGSTLEPFILTASPEGGWSWFGDPRAFYHDGKTYFAYISGEGHPMAAEYVHATELTSTPARLYPAAAFEVDDHDNPAILRRASDGKLVTAYTVHVGDPYVNVSTNADDATTWDGPTNLSASLGTYFTYGRLYQLTGEANDPIYLFMRQHPGGIDPAELVYAKSTDDGVTWTGPTRVCVVVYHKIAQVGDRLHFLISDHPLYEGFTSIYHMYYEGGSWYKSDGTEITASQPFAQTAATLVYDGSTERGWIWDIAVEPVTGFPVAVYIVYEETYPSGAWRYEYARWNGSAWENHLVADAGSSIYSPPGDNDYAGGIVLDHSDPSIVYYSTNAVSGNWEIYRASTDDDGVTWNATAITADEGNVKNIRPVSVRDHAADLQVLWMRGTYLGYTDWSTGTSGAGL